MADAIVRLRVESSEYDQKLSRATQQLQHMEKEVRRTGATFAYADKEELEFIRSIGQMETKASSAQQKLHEYSEAITTLTASLKAMTDEERNSKFGQAMAASIEQLKQKAADLQNIMSDTQKEIRNIASDTSLTDGLSLITRTIGASAAAITAWTGDSREMEAVMKDLAKIGTTVAAVDSLTKAFQKQNLVLLKNPYVAAAAGAVALAVALGKLIQKSKELDNVTKAINDVRNKGAENAAKEITRIDSLNNILHDNTRSLDERKAALQEIQNLVPDYHGALTEEGNLINDNTSAMDDYIESLQRAAIAQAAFDRMVELQKQKLQQQLDLQEKQKALESARTRNTNAQGQVVYAGTEFTQVYTQQGESAAERAVQKAEADIRSTDAEIDALRSLINVKDIETGSGRANAVKAGRNIAKTSGRGFEFGNYLDMPLAGSLADLERQASIVQESMKNATTPEEYKEMEEHLNTITNQMKVLKGEMDVTFAPGSLNDLQQKLKEAQDTLNNLVPGTKEWADALVDVQAKQKAVNDLQDKMKLNVSETASAMEDWSRSIDMLGEGVGAIDTLVGALDNLKRIGEDLADAFSGEMDAWDALMTVFNSGIGIMDTVISVMEAINTLQSLSSDLSKKKVADQAAETTAVVAGKSAEATANLQEAGTSMTAAGANAAQSSSAAGKSVAGIPIVGPILAVAAIAAVLAATFAAISKSKSAGRFATGGLIPGNSFSGDNLTANVNSGELILNKAQQGIIAGHLAGNPMDDLNLSMEVEGTKMLILLNNTNRSLGGSRNFYSRRH